MKCSWCGWHGQEEELDFDEHDVPMYCPECGKIAYENGEIDVICKRFMKENPNYDAWFENMYSHAGYYPVVITDKRILKIPARYVFESIGDFEEWAKGVVLE